LSQTAAEGAQTPFGRFFLPGPTEVRPDVLSAQTRAMIGHRGPGIQEVMRPLQEGLKQVFLTDRPVFISSSSATGLMEAAVRNGASRRVLSLVNGAFSQRFAGIAKSCGLEVDEVSVPWGEAHDPAAVAAALEAASYDAVTVVHSETSTGALNDLPAISAVVRQHEDTLLLVDSVTGCGGAELRTDAWGLDFVLTGSQKALALPPGLSFGVASAAMMERSATATRKGFYFDLMEFQKNIDKLQTPTTPALSTMYALQVQLEHFAAETMEGRWARHTAMARRTHAWVDEMSDLGLSVMAPPGYRSPTVTAIDLPESMSGSAVVMDMRERGWVIGGGYGKLKETSIRIGHMGDHTLDELEALLEVLTEVIQ
jgi:predicted phosphoserine aminotransferase